MLGRLSASQSSERPIVQPFFGLNPDHGKGFVYPLLPRRVSIGQGKMGGEIDARAAQVIPIAAPTGGETTNDYSW
ncbi:MAG: hypothetical protein AAF357_18830 [Verrucomicrobiota bacterium]